MLEETDILQSISPKEDATMGTCIKERINPIAYKEKRILTFVDPISLFIFKLPFCIGFDSSISFLPIPGFQECCCSMSWLTWCL